jgi:hypothetical protein
MFGFNFIRHCETEGSSGSALVRFRATISFVP